MRPRQNFNCRHALADWIAQSADFNALITITLKQGLADQAKSHGLTTIKQEHCIHTAWLFRDRLSRKVHRRPKYQSSMPFAAFVEGDDVKRLHLHIMTACPNELAFEKFRMAVCAAAENLDWVHDRIDTRPITYGHSVYVANYCLKTGVDAFLPQASRL